MIFRDINTQFIYNCKVLIQFIIVLYWTKKTELLVLRVKFHLSSDKQYSYISLIRLSVINFIINNIIFYYFLLNY